MNNIINFLNDGRYTYITAFDTHTNEYQIMVKTTSDRVLNYKYDDKKNFKRMYYTYGNFDSLLETMLRCNLISGQFAEIKLHSDFNMAKDWKEEELEKKTGPWHRSLDWYDF